MVGSEAVAGWGLRLKHGGVLQEACPGRWDVAYLKLRQDLRERMAHLWQVSSPDKMGSDL